MKTVNIADLKNRLSRYLREVREGEEILVRDRDVPIAKIVPLSSRDDQDAVEESLIATGLLRPGKGRLPDSFWKRPAPRVSLKRLVEAMMADREEE